MRITYASLVMVVLIIVMACGRTAPHPAAEPNAGLGIDAGAFAFADRMHGVALKGPSSGIETRDGGKTWRPVSVDWGQTIGFAAGGTVLIAGVHAYGLHGDSWTPINPPPVPAEQLVLIWFVTQSQGFAWSRVSSGTGTLFATADGGVTWQVRSDLGKLPDLHLGVWSTNGPEEAAFVDSVHGWFTSQFPPTESAVLFATSDGGSTWAGLSLPQPANGPIDWLSVPRFFDPQHGVLFGLRHRLGSHGWMWSTADGGRTWANPRELPVASSTASFPDSTHWFISGTSDIFGTSDAGATWHRLAALNTSDWQLPIQFMDPSHGFALVVLSQRHPTCPPNADCAGPAAGEVHRQLVATDDGGLTWHPITQPPASHSP